MIIATLCYILKDNKTLMLQRNKFNKDAHRGKWNGLGGKLEQGETPEECVIREVLEESGLEIRNPKLKGRILFPSFNKQPEDWHVYVFIATEFYGEMKSGTEGNLEWIDNNKLFSLNLWEGDKVFLKWLKKDKFFSAKFIYDGDSLRDYSVIFYK